MTDKEALRYAKGKPDEPPVYVNREEAMQVVADRDALYKALEWAMSRISGSQWGAFGKFCVHCGIHQGIPAAGVVEKLAHRYDCPWVATHALLTRLAKKEKTDDPANKP